MWVHNTGCHLLTTSGPGAVVRNKLQRHELEQAQRIVAAHGGEFIGNAAKHRPGIDGTFNGVPAALKQTTSASPVSVLHHASKAEAASEKAGHVGVTVFVEAQRISSQALLDFARGGDQGLLKIANQGVVSRIEVLTADGWVTFVGRSVGR